MLLQQITVVMIRAPLPFLTLSSGSNNFLVSSSKAAVPTVFR